MLYRNDTKSAKWKEQKLEKLQPIFTGKYDW